MRAAEDSHWWYAGMREISAALLGKGLREGATVLDAGCGTGANLLWLRARGAHAVGIDLAPQAIAACIARGLTCVTRGSADALPFADATFEVVTCLDVLYHLGVRDDVGALREIRRVLRPGGVALIRVPAIPALYGAHDRSVHGRQRYRRAELREKIEAAGLRAERVTGANLILLPVAAAVRLRRRDASRAGTEVRVPSRLANAALGALLRFEAGMVRRWNLPTGLSLMAVARRPS